MEYADNELSLQFFREFPFDRNDTVCPTGALFWPHDADCPQIDKELCICCGICVTRCPAYAMSLSRSGAEINDAVNDHFLYADTKSSEDNSSDLKKFFFEVKESGLILVESDKLIESIYKRLISLAPSLDAQFPNHFTRNLLMAVGLKTAMRRRGDTNLRMDLLFEKNGSGGTGEVEFSTVTLLDAPRNVLDNVAVLVARYGLKKENIMPIIVSLSLPNQRSEYWQVIEDISRVLDIKISSITIGILMMMVWSRYKFLAALSNDFFVAPGTYSLRKNIEGVLNRQVRIDSGFLGIIESSK
jgi:ferredoxin